MSTPNYPSRRITGIQGLIPQTLRIRYDPRTGGSTDSHWAGQLNPCLNQAALLQAQGWSYDLYSPNGGANWRLDANIADIYSRVSGINGNVVDQWELTSNKVEVDFLNSVSPLINALTTADIFLLSNFISQQVDVGQVTWSGSTPNLPSYTAVTPAYNLSSGGKTVLSLLLSGQKSQVIFQPVLRQTRTTSNIYAIAASTANVNSILTTAEVVSLINVPVAFAVPSDPVYGKIGFTYGWKKDFPNVVSAAGLKTQIITEYEFGLWNTANNIFV